MIAIFSLPVYYDILIVDDGSPDGTAAIVKSLQASLSRNAFHARREGKQGLGTAYILGFKWAISHNYDFIFEMDADFSHNPQDLMLCINACLNGADMAMDHGINRELTW